MKSVKSEVTLVVLGLINGLKAGIFLGSTVLLPIPFVPDAVTGLFGFYFLTVSARLLGVMYHTNRSEIGWFENLGR